MYDGFISYSHAADGRLAPALQRGLQRLAKRWNSRRALHVFRDETGLSTNPHLWSAIETALADSDWFVLLASPESAASEWVNREVAHWVADQARRSHPAGRDRRGVEVGPVDQRFHRRFHGGAARLEACDAKRHATSTCAGRARTPISICATAASAPDRRSCGTRCTALPRTTSRARTSANRNAPNGSRVAHHDRGVVARRRGRVRRVRGEPTQPGQP